MSFSGPAFQFVTVLLILLAQGQQCVMIEIVSRNVHYHVSCCTTSSTSRITERVRACFEQKPQMFRSCEIHSYLFITVKGEQLCVDPSANWLPQRLQKLKRQGKSCVVL